jgi:hypothetical protein
MGSWIVAELFAELLAKLLAAGRVTSREIGRGMRCG